MSPMTGALARYGDAGYIDMWKSLDKKKDAPDCRWSVAAKRCVITKMEERINIGSQDTSMSPFSLTVQSLFTVQSMANKY